MRTTRRGLVGVAVAIIAIGGVAAIGLLGSDAPRRDPSTPAGVVQTYLSAVLEGRTAEAAALLDPSSGCSARDLDTTYLPPSARIDLIDARETGDTAQVRVHVEQSTGDPFGGTWGEDRTFRLTRVAGAWRITGVPWPLGGCGAKVPA